MRKIYHSIFFVNLIIAFINSHAQNSPYLKDSTTYSTLLFECTNNFDDKPKFNESIKKLRVLEKTINKPFVIGKVDMMLGVHYTEEGLYDSSNYFLNQAIKKFNDPSLAYEHAHYFHANCLAQISLNYTMKGDIKKETEVLLEYLNLAKKYELFKQQADAYSRLGNMFDSEKKPQLAIAYIYKGLEVCNKNNLKKKFAELYNMLGTSFYSLCNLDSTYSKQSLRYVDSSLKYFNAAISASQQTEDSVSLARAYNNMVGVYEYKKEYKKAFDCISQSLKIMKIVDEEYALVSPMANLSYAYFNLKDYDNAKLYLDSTLLLAKKYNNNEALLRCYDLGINISKRKNDYQAAFKYLQEKNNVNDLVYGTETSNKISELELKFRTKENETTIIQQNQKLEQRNKMITLIIVIVCLIALLSILLFSRFKTKKNKQLIEQENLASIKIIQSEQQERMRIARELHDGIGQKLTVLKMYTGEENKLQANLLEETINEVRSISHKMMPEIINLGLIPAIKDLCEKINNSGTISCIYELDEASKSIMFAKDIELSIYRIVQEVLNNMLKHAKAKQISVNFTTIGNNLKINITDDGVGFDTKKIHTSTGIGWSNIITRAKIIKANLDINSSNKGTNIVLNINI
jgi:two-component system, NarL family, sensor kinase